jgi:hypothetical protein
VTVSPEGSHIAAWNTKGLIELTSLVGFKKKRNIGSHQGTQVGVWIAPDAKFVASVGGPHRSTIRVWEVAKAGSPLQWAAHAPKLDQQQDIRRELGDKQSGVMAVAFSDDCRVLATGGRDGDVSLWEVATGLEICRFEGHRICDSFVVSVCFDASGRKIVSASFDGKIVVWDIVQRLFGDKTPSNRLGAMELVDHWTTLGNHHSAQGYSALESLAVAPSSVLPFLKDRFGPLAAVDATLIGQWVVDLNNNDFKIRDKAMHELRKVGESARPALEKALAKDPPLEMKKRIDQLLDRLEPGRMDPERLRLLRTIQLLEKIGTAEARELLERFATGNPADPLTQDAVATLERMKRKKP